MLWKDCGKMRERRIRENLVRFFMQNRQKYRNIKRKMVIFTYESAVGAYREGVK